MSRRIYTIMRSHPAACNQLFQRLNKPAETLALTGIYIIFNVRTISMKMNQYLLLVASLFFASIVSAQKKSDFLIALKNGDVATQVNINQPVVDSFNKKAIRSNNKSFFVIQFESIPTTSVRQELSANGIELLDYIPNNAYTATITGDLKLNTLLSARARTVLQLSAEQK